MSVEYISVDKVYEQDGNNRVRVRYYGTTHDGKRHRTSMSIAAEILERVELKKEILFIETENLLKITS